MTRMTLFLIDSLRVKYLRFGWVGGGESLEVKLENFEQTRFVSQSKVCPLCSELIFLLVV